MARPTNQHVVSDLLEPLALAAHAVQRLQQDRAHALLGSGAEAAILDLGFVHGGALRVHRRQRFVDPLANRAKRVVRRHEVLQPHRGV
jgi:Fe2+ transport system protein FeoA